MRFLFALILMSGTASASFIDFQGSGGRASYDGATLSGSANLSFLATSGTNHDGTTSVNATLAFTQSSFTVTGQIAGVTGNEVLFSGLFSFGPTITHPIGGDITFILGAGTGTLATDVANYYGATLTEFSGLSVTVKDVTTPSFTNATISSTDFSIGATSVPEPSSLILLSLGGLAIYCKRK